MIETKDLRRGNLVLARGAESIVGAIFENQIAYKKNSGVGETSLPMKFVQGVPLTERWLLKLGFEKYDDFIEYHKVVQTATGPKTVEYCSEDGSLFLDSDKIEVINVDNVHEMQNALWVMNDFRDIKLKQ